uniref:Polygalacturonase n=1 Tax=Kalanchoe fedtschenkoi TaxID=63787 RepID=A0A7N0U7V0_KALFE
MAFRIFLLAACLAFVSCFINSSHAALLNLNVVTYGAPATGLSDATPAFLKAWTAACSSASEATITVPQGRYMIKPVIFRGPCKNSITFKISGTIVAPSGLNALGNTGYWILFIKVNKLSVLGGTLDAKAANFWACRKAGKSCPVGARSMTFNWVNDGLISGLTSINSQMSHLVINSCNNVVVQNVRLTAPDDSPNTDGIHVQGSTGVTITGSTLRTGDDCVSIGPSSKNLYISGIKCGPGHGVSIGSLGNSANEGGVQNVTLINSIFTGSDNGVRLKTWARASNSFVNNVAFENLIMSNTRNPILIDQNYCPSNTGCPTQSSGVKISQITYKNIKGTSASPIAVKMDCSPSKPCSGIKLQDINLTYMNTKATAYCKNAGGTSSSVISPQSCL